MEMGIQYQDWGQKLQISGNVEQFQPGEQANNENDDLKLNDNSTHQSQQPHDTKEAEPDPAVPAPDDGEFDLS